MGAITAYEVARRATAAGHPPVALFTAAVSPPHIYAAAVMKLYITRELGADEEPPLEEVMEKLRGWDKLPKETLMLASRPILSDHLSSCKCISPARVMQFCWQLQSST